MPISIGFQSQFKVSWSILIQNIGFFFQWITNSKENVQQIQNIFKKNYEN